MSRTKDKYCDSECSEQCEDDEKCNEECMEYCTTKTKPKSGMFSMLFSGWGLLLTICCCFLLIGACLFFLFKKDSKHQGQMGYNPYTMQQMSPMPHMSQMTPTPGFASFQGQPFNVPIASNPRFDPTTGERLF